MNNKLKAKLIKLSGYSYELFSIMENVETRYSIDKKEFYKNFDELEMIVQNFDEANIDSEDTLSSIGGLYLAFIVARNIIKKGEMN